MHLRKEILLLYFIFNNKKKDIEVSSSRRPSNSLFNSGVVFFSRISF